MDKKMELLLTLKNMLDLGSLSWTLTALPSVVWLAGGPPVKVRNPKP